MSELIDIFHAAIMAVIVVGLFRARKANHPYDEDRYYFWAIIVDAFIVLGAVLLTVAASTSDAINALER